MSAEVGDMCPTSGVWTSCPAVKDCSLVVWSLLIIVHQSLQRWQFYRLPEGALTCCFLFQPVCGSSLSHAIQLHLS